MNPFFALAPFVVIAGTAVAVMLGIALKRNFGPAFAMAACGIIASLLTLRMPWRDSPIQAGLLIWLDDYALFYMALLLSAGLAVLGLCYDYFKDREGQHEELPLLLLTALLGALVLVGSSHFASFFIGLELLGISLFALIGYPLNQARSLEAALKYLILSGMSSAFLLMGMALIYAQCGELYFSGIGRYIAGQQDINVTVLSGTLLIVAGLAFKLSLAPFHWWTPDVYEGAPAPITAFIATVSKSAVFVLLLRYFISSGSYSYAPLLNVFSVIAGLSIVGGNLLALLQNNVKRLLAYSSIAHMGYLLVALIAGGSIVVETFAFYLPAYCMTTIGAFGVVSVLSTAQTEADDMACYRGLFWRRPWLAATFTLMLLSLAGIPLTVGFIGKFYILTGASGSRLWGLLLAVIIGSGLGLYYYLRIVVAMSMHGETTATVKPFGRDRASTAILAVLTLLVVWLGVYPSLLMNVIHSITYVIE
ncbi:MAG: NADH-quinone oxidoreductase subunit N [Methylobacter sp.]|nr:NADH-quinone oxidoreductase subunit N [Methylobacter sp.]